MNRIKRFVRKFQIDKLSSRSPPFPFEIGALPRDCSMHLNTRNAQDFFLPSHCPTVVPCYLRRDTSSRRMWRSLLHKRPLQFILGAGQRGRGSRWGVVQLVGHLTVNEDGEGSNPSAPAKFFRFVGRARDQSLVVGKPACSQPFQPPSIDSTFV